MAVRILCIPIRSWRARYKAWRKQALWEKARTNALFRASNGEHLPRLEREMYNLPDWTS